MITLQDVQGAAARIAVEYVKNAEPDGSVMLFTPDFPMTLYPHSFKSLNYDPIKDFIAVSPAAKGMLTFVIGPEVSGDVTYPVPDIQATAIRLEDSAIVGQAAASDIIGKGVQAGRVIRQFDVSDITEATAIALMEDMLTGKR